jgi:hypothetical protein
MSARCHRDNPGLNLVFSKPCVHVQYRTCTPFTRATACASAEASSYPVGRRCIASHGDGCGARQPQSRWTRDFSQAASVRAALGLCVAHRAPRAAAATDRGSAPSSGRGPPRTRGLRTPGCAASGRTPHTAIPSRPEGGRLAGEHLDRVRARRRQQEPDLSTASFNGDRQTVRTRAATTSTWTRPCMAAIPRCTSTRPTTGTPRSRSGPRRPIPPEARLQAVLRGAMSDGQRARIDGPRCLGDTPESPVLQAKSLISPCPVRWLTSPELALLAFRPERAARTRSILGSE